MTMNTLTGDGLRSDENSKNKGLKSSQVIIISDDDDDGEKLSDDDFMETLKSFNRLSISAPKDRIIQARGQRDNLETIITCSASVKGLEKYPSGEIPIHEKASRVNRKDRHQVKSPHPQSTQYDSKHDRKHLKEISGYHSKPLKKDQLSSQQQQLSTSSFMTPYRSNQTFSRLPPVSVIHYNNTEDVPSNFDRGIFSKNTLIKNSLYSHQHFPPKVLPSSCLPQYQKTSDVITLRNNLDSSQGIRVKFKYKESSHKKDTTVFIKETHTNEQNSKIDRRSTSKYFDRTSSPPIQNSVPNKYNVSRFNQNLTKNHISASYDKYRSIKNPNSAPDTPSPPGSRPTSPVHVEKLEFGTQKLPSQSNSESALSRPKKEKENVLQHNNLFIRRSRQTKLDNFFSEKYKYQNTHSLLNKVPSSKSDTIPLSSKWISQAKKSSFSEYRGSNDNFEQSALTQMKHHIEPRIIVDENAEDENDEDKSIELIPDISSDEIDSETEEEFEKLSFNLLPHQKTGVKWLIDRERSKVAGAILADDMGLGKTVQTIALISLYTPQESKENYPLHKTLILSPLATINQWANEFKKFAPSLKVFVHQGNKRTKDFKCFLPYDVILSTYDVITVDFKSLKDKTSDKNYPLLDFDWYRVVLDEAQKIKNKDAKVSLACYELKSKKRICLSGTPLQNDLKELYSFLCFLKYSPYDEYTYFSETIIRPFNRGHKFVVNNRISDITKELMLRRTKDMKIQGKPIIDLLPKTYHLVKSPFSNEHEKSAYHEMEDLVKNYFRYRMEKQESIDASSLLAAIMRLRQLCDHPYLTVASVTNFDINPALSLETPNEKSDNLDSLIDDLTSLRLDSNSCSTGRGESVRERENEWRLDNAVDSTCTALDKFNLKLTKTNQNQFMSPSFHSTKIGMLLDVLKRILNEERNERNVSSTENAEHTSLCTTKVIVFSQFTTMLDVIENVLKKEKIKFLRYDGRLNRQVRDENLRIFSSSDHEDTRVLLISLGSGSVGLNLVRASVVILVDIWWNPFVEEQAIDRVYRIGQTKEVHIYRLIIQDSIEERILQLQEKKRTMVKEAMEAPTSEDSVKKLSKSQKNVKTSSEELLKLLFKPSKPAHCDRFGRSRNS